MRTTSDRCYAIAAGTATIALFVTLALGCASVRGPYTTKRDKTKKGAGIGAAAGAAAAILKGEREADEILAGAAVGAAVGAGVGVYMDRQEERLARIPGTTPERVSEDVLLVHFDSDVLFDIDSASLDSEGRTTLDQVADVLLEYPKTAVVLQGHTDSTGSEEHNFALSQRRAEAVRNFLVGQAIDSSRISAVGHGESYPRADNDTAAGRQLNRRVDMLLKAKAT
jgi:outer membrane protein OmpA-like peptidoglycan-associated protein